MVKSEKIKVVWLANFLNPEIRTHLEFRVSFIEKVLRKLTKRDYSLPSDSGQWVTNGIREFESFEDVELHIITPVSHLSKKETTFIRKGIHYYFFRNEFGTGMEILKRNLYTNHFCEYKNNRKYIIKKIKEIAPDIIHLIGAENPSYSLSMLDIPTSTPTIVQLQTLLADPSFREGYPISDSEYYNRLQCEKDVICRADYVGTGVVSFLPIIRREIKSEVKVLNMPLALAEQINIHQEEKEFDIVYFAKNINKAADWAVEAFCRASLKHPELTFHIIGSYSNEYRASLEQRLQESHIFDNVVFEGELQTHDDVIRLIRKARVALLPLKVDFISGTIREAMCNGIPVVTTITPGTPRLNKKKESVLLSEQGDFDGMANNILRLIDNPALGERLIHNAAETMREQSDNQSRMRTSVDVYKACIENYKYGTSIPSKLLIQ